MALVKLDFLPGINKENTPYSNEGGWVNSDKIRFRSGKPEKIGGWTRYRDTPLEGTIRSLRSFRTLDGTIYLVIGTNEKVYIEEGGAFTDITPLRETQALTNPFDTTAGSAVITVNDTAHGAIDGAWVTISGSADVDGIPAAEINAEHQITLVDANSYTITVTTTGSAGVTGGGGASVSAAYQINPGLADGAYQYGWGTAAWGVSTWGTPRTTAAILLYPRIWNFQSWGEDVIINYRGGAVYVWDASNPFTRATQITDAPHKVGNIIVTKDRHLVCFGSNLPGTSNASTAFDDLQIRWSDQENYSDWTVTVTNTAGDYLLTNGTKIVGAANVESQVILWTDDDVQSMQYIGPPYTFGFNQIGTEAGLASPYAWVAYNNVVYWMGDNAFYYYQGGTSVLPCTVQKYVFEEFDAPQRDKTFATLNRENHEITWFYPAESNVNRTLNGAVTNSQTYLMLDTTAGLPFSGTVLLDSEQITYTGKTDTRLTGCTRGVNGTTATTHADGASLNTTDGSWSNEPYHYVTFNVIDQIWWVGKLERSAWVDKGALKYPIAAGPDGYLYEHEQGYDANGDPLVASIESADFDLGEGDQVMFVRRVIPDFTISGGDVNLTLRTRRYPLSSQVSETVGTITSSTTKVDTRIRGRQLALFIESNGVGDWWKYGATRIDQQPDGMR